MLDEHALDTLARLVSCLRSLFRGLGPTLSLLMMIAVRCATVSSSSFAKRGFPEIHR